MVRAITLRRLAARLAVILPFAALLYAPSPALAVPFLGSAESFAVLGASAISNTNATTIQGDLGIAPGLAGSFTGGPPLITITGAIFAGAVSPDPVASLAQSDALTARNALALLPFPIANNLSGQDLGTVGTLTPGIYHFDAAAGLTGTLTLDAGNDPNALFVFQIGSALTTAPSATVNMIRGGANEGVYWVVGTSATLDSSTTFAGNILADQSITMNSSATILCGRAIALNAAVTMDNNTISNDCNAANGGTRRTDFSSLGFSGGFGGGQTVPEPSTFLLLATGLIGVAAWMRRARAR
jgi:hypothetical protein